MVFPGSYRRWNYRVKGSKKLDSMKNVVLPKEWRGKVIGIALMLINLCWVYYNFRLFYRYHYTSMLFLVKIPDQVLLLNLLLGICGVLIGLGVYKNTLGAIKWSLINGGVIIFGMLLEGFATS